MYARCKTYLERCLADDALFYGLLILSVGVTSFGLGRLSVTENDSIVQPASVSLTHSPAASTATTPVASTETAQFVASKNSTKYHRLDCPGAKQIAEQNKIFFASVAEAASSGYTRAANCPEL